MSRKTKIPAIGSIPSGIDARLRSVLQAIKEALEIQVGQRGDDLDKAVTFRDLTDSGMIETPAAGVSTSGSTIIPVTNPGDLSQPPLPYSLTASGTFTNVLLMWEGGFRHPLVGATEIYRHTSDDLNSASHIGTTASFVYTDTVEPGSTHYYWIRFRSTSGVAGPFNATSGTVATTNKKVSDLIADLSDAIGTSELSTALSTQITGHGASITNQQTTINGISATSYVKVSAGGQFQGIYAGYGASATATSSEFVVDAGVFKIGSSSDNVLPFIVVTGTTALHGLTTAADGTTYTNTLESFQLANHPTGKWFARGTYIDSAHIADASIDSAKIGSLNVDEINITGQLGAAQIGAGTIKSVSIDGDGISADKITMDGNIQFGGPNSNNWTGTSGIQFGKTSLGSTTTGAFFGRSGGVSGFSISSANSGIYADSSGEMRLNNVKIYTGSAGTPLVWANPGTYTANISSSTGVIEITVIGAGAGAGTNSSGLGYGLTASQIAGGNGTASWLEFRNSSNQLVGTRLTAAGGTGAFSVGPNNSNATGFAGASSTQAGSSGAGASGSNLPSNGTKGGGGGGAGNPNPINYSRYAPVNVSAAAGTTVTFSAQKPAGATQVRVFIGTGGTGAQYSFAGNNSNAAFVTTKGGDGGSGYVTMADPYNGGVEVDLIALANRITVLEGHH